MIAQSMAIARFLAREFGLAGRQPNKDDNVNNHGKDDNEDDDHDDDDHGDDSVFYL